MGISLEQLWKDSTDAQIVEAIGKWTTTNDETKRVLAAEAKRRGLKIAVPEVPAAPAHAPSTAPSPFSPKVLLFIAAIFAMVIALAVFVR